MTRCLLLVCGLLYSLTATLWAQKFDPDTKYKIGCKYYGTGVVVPGVAHGQTPELYFDTSGTLTDDAWWYIKADGAGYTISNASSRQYITYTTERFPGAVKGLKLTDMAQNDDSRWTFEKRGDYYVIKSVSNPTQWFNLRSDGTYLLGTYTGSGSDNECFSITSDESGGGDDKPTVPFTGMAGISDQGEYWENTGLPQPVVYTEDTSNPVLYSIVNLRTKYYAYNDAGSIAETIYAPARGQFYFVKTNGGVQIYTSTGSHVSTYYTEFMESSDNPGLSLYEGTAEGNTWTFGYGDNTNIPGYTIEKTDNLPSQDYYQSEHCFWNDYGGHHIGLWDVDDGSTFVFASSDTRHVTFLQRQGISFEGGGGILPDNDSFAAAIDSLRLGGKQLVYDALSNSYLMQLPTSLRNGGDWQTTLMAKPAEGHEGWNVTLEEASTEGTDGEVALTGVNCQTDYHLVLTDNEGTEKDRATLRFTFLPIVEVNVPSCNGSTYTTGSIRVTDADIEGYDSTFIAAYRYRGATAMGMSKKAYAIKMRDEEGNSVDRSFFGLRNDNNWILDAMAVDPACMRNRVSTDLWNDFSTPPYYKDREKKARTGTRGRFVEVFLNGKYHGIYCMTEKLDRKQLKLKKYVEPEKSTTGEAEIHGLLYKSSQWCYEVFMGHDMDQEYFPGYSPTPYFNQMGVETWCEYELKYPDYEEEAVDWGPLWNAVNFVATSRQQEFDNELATRFDYPVLKDYYLFIELLLATDNHGKNMFYFVYDKEGAEGERLGLAPWDLDGVLGARWDGSTDLTYPDQDFDNFLWANEHGEHTIYYRLKHSSLSWADELKARYCELRDNAWNEQSLRRRVTDYAALFAESGADLREAERWPQYHPDIASAADYTDNWLHERIAFLDDKYGYDPLASSLNEARAEAYFQAVGGKGAIAITAGKAQSVNLYNGSGILLRKVQLDQGFNTVGGLMPGIYIVGGSKVAVE